MTKTLVIVLIVALAILAFWFVKSPTTQAPTTEANPDSAASLQSELDAVNLGDPNDGFGTVDTDITAL